MSLENFMKHYNNISKILHISILLLSITRTVTTPTDLKEIEIATSYLPVITMKIVAMDIPYLNAKTY